MMLVQLTPRQADALMREIIWVRECVEAAQRHTTSPREALNLIHRVRTLATVQLANLERQLNEEIRYHSLTGEPNDERPNKG
jgi:hypothetical protein